MKPIDKIERFEKIDLRAVPANRPGWIRNNFPKRPVVFDGAAGKPAPIGIKIKAS
ncbi:hypothetical protein SAMN05660226_02256 [Parapedobacter luteus]|uniref:Uncharacterized protein n=1 Tax=Parapedobacter luteus TaxID=623280 RepID=A0A1T5CJ67_9SPHI|nr:hypothetical protein SAMN05660226_02256 [Parapedobacter luteus]